MQENWSDAVTVFGDHAERAMLGSWVINDINDTRVDRSLFRREVRDANMAVASFVSQADPELAPRFRGHDLTVAGLGRLFHDPRPLITGGHEANELMLLARPELLRQMSAHRTGDSAQLSRLARDIETAERTGAVFHRELTQNLVGWRRFEGRTDPALVLTFLLHPELAVAPDPGDLPGVRVWTSVLWSRVESASGARRAGYAAAVYAALPSIVTLARQRGVWERKKEVLDREHRMLAGAVAAQNEHRSVQVMLGLAVIPLLGASFVLDSAVPDSGIGMLFFLASTGSFLAWVVLTVQRSHRHGSDALRASRELRLQNIPGQDRGLVEGLRMMDRDLARARQLCSRPPRHSD
ncbi:hypothetical protein ACWFMI_11275 [Nocardiopsis terrae]